MITTPRSPRHYILRASYVALFFVLMWTAWQAIVGFQTVQRLGDIAQFNVILFELFAYTQLTLVLFAASLYGTSSISHEKDRRTFILLLVTRLTDQEIVTHKFLCALLQVGCAVLASAPVFMLSALMGGVGFAEVARVFMITAGAALVSGAAGVLIAVWREKTFQAVAMTMLAIVLSLLAIEVVAGLAGSLPIAGVSIDRWCACLSPYRAIASIVGQVPTPLPIFGDAGVGYLVVSSTCAMAFLATGVFYLRAWNPRGEPVQQREAPSDGTNASRAASIRTVSGNPVFWRETQTRAYGTKPVLIKVGYLIVVAVLVASLWWLRPSPDDPRIHLVVARTLLPIAILSLMLVNAQAVTAVTTERDLKSIDLLLVTDITPREFVYGKLGGIFYNAKEMVIAPILMLALCAFLGLTGAMGFTYTFITLIVFAIFSAILGVHTALRYDSTRVALANSLGTMFLLFVGILLCLFLILISGRFEAQWAEFVLFIILGSIGLWVSLSANAPTNAIGLTACILPSATFYCIIAFLVGDRTFPFLVGSGAYGFAVAALLIPLLAEFDVATGRTTAEEG